MEMQNVELCENRIFKDVHFLLCFEICLHKEEVESAQNRVHIGSSPNAQTNIGICPQALISNF